jgi:hypothetical protein
MSAVCQEHDPAIVVEVRFWDAYGSRNDAAANGVMILLHRGLVTLDNVKDLVGASSHDGVICLLRLT